MIQNVIAQFVRLITGVRLNHDHERQTSARIYYANHSSHLDFVVIWAALPSHARKRARPIAAADYWNRGPIRRYLAGKIFKAVLIPRGKVTRHDDPIGMMSTVIEQGNDLIIFPEGTRSEDGKVADFRSGLYALAQLHPQAELIPVYLENLNHILPKGEFLMVPIIGNAIFGNPCEGPRHGETRHDFLLRARNSLLTLTGHLPPTTQAPCSDEP